MGPYKSSLAHSNIKKAWVLTKRSIPVFDVAFYISFGDVIKVAHHGCMYQQGPLLLNCITVTLQYSWPLSWSCIHRIKFDFKVDIYRKMLVLIYFKRIYLLFPGFYVVFDTVQYSLSFWQKNMVRSIKNQRNHGNAHVLLKY